MAIEINNKKYCPYCFRQLEEGECSCSMTANDKKYLPVGHILNGSIIVGSLIRSTGYVSDYLGFEPKTEKKLIIKEFNPSILAIRYDDGTIKVKDGYKAAFKNAQRLFINRMQVMQSEISNPSVFKVQSAFMQNDTSYYLAEYSEEKLLKTFIKSPKNVSKDKVISSMYNSLMLLRSIHNKGMIHGNISADTVYVGEEGIIIDGFEPAEEEIGVFLRDSVMFEHSMEYLPAFYFSGDKNNPSVDIFSLGAVMYSLLTGKTPESPFSGGSQIDIEELRDSGVGLELCSVISRMCPEKGVVFSSVDEVIEELKGTFRKSGFEIPKTVKKIEPILGDEFVQEIRSGKVVNKSSGSRTVITHSKTGTGQHTKSIVILVVIAIIVLTSLAIVFLIRNKGGTGEKEETISTTAPVSSQSQTVDEKESSSVEDTSETSKAPVSINRSSQGIREKSSTDDENEPSSSEQSISKKTPITSKKPKNVIIGN